MRLAIVEDSVPILENLKILLGGEAGITIVGAFSTAEDALRQIDRIAPEIMLVDLGLPGMPGTEFIAEAKERHPRLEVMVYSVFDDPVNVFAALKAGATAYILKGTKPKDLVEAIAGLHQGGSPMSPKIARMVIAEFHDESGNNAHSLTAREKEILAGMDKHLTYKELADKLCISPFTVRTHTKNIYEKLQARNKEEALRKARLGGAI
jgi:two-component system NarL family response regulator